MTNSSPSDVEYPPGESIDNFNDMLNRKRNQDSSKQVTVKFLAPESRVFTQSYPEKHTISKIKSNFVDLFSVPYGVIALLYQDVELEDNKKLKELTCDKFGIIELKLLCNNIHYKINVENVYRGLTIPDVLTVRVPTEEGLKDVVVEIENQTIVKPYQGGYKNILTGVQYHHGFSQTGPVSDKVPPHMKSHRDTQCYITRNRKTDMDYSRGTQMTSENTWIPNVTDKLLIPGPYETADERAARLDIEGKVRTIQRYYRAMKMKRALKELSAEYKKRIRLQQEREARELEEEENRKILDLIGKAFPLTATDFAMLYCLVDKWKMSEIGRINSRYCGAAKIAEFYLLLDREIEVLQAIDKIRQRVRNDIETQKIVTFFKTIGTPLKWNSEYKNLACEMDSLETQKGREYFALYKSICNRNLTREEKIQVYLNIKSYLSSHSCDDGIELTGLLDRACELLARGTEEKYLTALHKRIEALLLHHFKQTDCNEGVTNHMIRLDEKLMEENLCFCQKCQKLKTIEYFNLNGRTTKIKICKSCQWIDKSTEPWVDLAPYRFILKQIRNSERLLKATSSVVFVLQDTDILHIVQGIWHGHSALSENSDLYQLRLCRWNLNEEWSPWNCVLLTKEETKSHLKVTFEGVYDKIFLAYVYSKHALAKIHFEHLITFDKRFTDRAKANPKLDGETEYNKMVPVNSKPKIFYSCH